MFLDTAETIYRVCGVNGWLTFSSQMSVLLVSIHHIAIQASPTMSWVKMVFKLSIRSWQSLCLIAQFWFVKKRIIKKKFLNVWSGIMPWNAASPICVRLSMQGCADLMSVSISSPGSAAFFFFFSCRKVKIWKSFHCQQDILEEIPYLIFKTLHFNNSGKFMQQNIKRWQAKKKKRKKQIWIRTTPSLAWAQIWALKMILKT